MFSAPQHRAKSSTFAFFLTREAEWDGSDKLHRYLVYETCTILSSLLKNSPNSSKKKETNPVLPLKKLDLSNCGSLFLLPSWKAFRNHGGMAGY
jgi:hypothetical protein